MDDQAERVENAAYGEFALRIVRAAGKRCATGDPEDLDLLDRLRLEIDYAWYVGVLGLLKQGHSYRTIGQALGLTSQAVHQRYRRYEDVFTG